MALFHFAVQSLRDGALNVLQQSCVVVCVGRVGGWRVLA